jgi:hypothetical protein
VTSQTFTCTSTYSTGTSTATDHTTQYIMLIQQFSAMQFKISESNGTGTGNNETFSYAVTSSSGGIYNVNMSIVSTSVQTSFGFVIDSNNATVISVTIQGFTEHGSIAKTEFDSFMGLFGLQLTYQSELSVFTDSAYFHSTGTTSMTFGTVTFPVTTYSANNLPTTVNECGVTSTLTAYTLEVGTPPGTSTQFITLLHVAGTSTSGAYDVTFQLISMTVA